MDLEFREAVSCAERLSLTQLQSRERTEGSPLVRDRVGSEWTRHFGLFGPSAQPVAYVEVAEAFADTRTLQSPHPLPLVRFFGHKSRVWAVVWRIIRKYGVAVAVSGIVQGAPGPSMKLSRHIHESLIGIYVIGLQIPCFLACQKGLKKWCEHLGFRQVFKDETPLASNDALPHFIRMYGVRLTDEQTKQRSHRLLQAFCRCGVTLVHSHDPLNVALEGVRHGAMQSILRLALRDAA